MPPFAVAKRMVSGLALIAAALIPLGCEQSPGPAAAPPSETQRPPPRPARLGPPGAPGGRVRRAQTVARLDPTDAQLRVDQAVAALQQARARLGLAPEGTGDPVDPDHTSLGRQARAVLDEARLTRARTERLWKQELIAQAQVDTAVSSLAVAEARYQDAIEEARTRQAVLLQRRSELALARQQRADTVVTSPIEGAVSERRASVGEYLAAGAPGVTLVKLPPLRLRLAVPERDATAVRVGQPVVVTVEGAAGEHRGRVARISPALSEQKRPHP